MLVMSQTFERQKEINNSEDHQIKRLFLDNIDMSDKNRLEVINE